MSTSSFTYYPLVVLIIFIFICSIKANCQEHGVGFIMYCPCMGRFGNQAEQLLGSLLFAKSLNRTLLLPPFIHYGLNHFPLLVPFEEVIQLKPLKEYHNVKLLSDFMDNRSEVDWPPSSRKFFCFSSRNLDGHCDAMKGQPFNHFWTSFNITEEASIIYKPLSTSPNQANEWNRLYPPATHPVLTFVGAPSPFPTHRAAIPIQKYIRFSNNVENEALRFKEENDFLEKPYLSIHIRHGPDWKKACEVLRSSQDLDEFFSSNQCTNYKPNEDRKPHKDKLQFDTCLPSIETIMKKLNYTLETYRDLLYDDKSKAIVHIATDYDDQSLYDKLEIEFHHQVKFLVTPRNESTMQGALLDLYLMSHANVFIGNCISSFSAFSARIRSEQFGPELAPTHYFGQDFESKNFIKNRVNDEL